MYSRGMEQYTWTSSEADYAQALLSQNPWVGSGRVPETFAPPVRRPLVEHLSRALLTGSSRFQVIMGPRRVGKTVTMHQTIAQLLADGIQPNRLWFLRLDHPLLMDHDLGFWAKFAITESRASVAEPVYLFLDEINYAKQWDKWLKTFFDERWPVRIVATSSSAAALRDRTVESGIGRWSEQFLMPYSFSEFVALRGERTALPAAAGDLFSTLTAVIEARPDIGSAAELLKPFLLVGGFPELLSALTLDDEGDVREALFRSQQVLRSEAVQRVTGMDLPQALDIRNPQLLERLLYILAGQMCGLVNIAELSRQVELARPTVQQYVAHLEQAYLIFSLNNFSNNEAAVQRKARKIFFVDGAVRNAALQRGVAPLEDPGEWGYLIENTAAAHLFAMSMQTGGRLYHWRDDQLEVDLVYSDGASSMAFEIASGQSHNQRGLRAIAERYPNLRNRCFMVHASGPKIYERPSADNGGIGRLPLDAFLLAVGAQSQAGMAAKMNMSASAPAPAAALP